MAEQLLKHKPSTFKLGLFLIKTRLRLIFSGDENTALNIGRVFLVLFLILYSVLAGFTLLLSDPDSLRLFYVAIMGSIPAIIISSGIFPVLKLPTSVVPGYAPVPSRQAGVLNLMYNLCRPGTIYGLIFLVTTSVITYSMGPWLLFDGILLIIATSSLDFAVKQTILAVQTKGFKGFRFLLLVGLVNVLGLSLYFVIYFFNLLSAPEHFSMYLLLFTISCVVYYSYTIELTETPDSDSVFASDTIINKPVKSLGMAARIAYGRKRSTRPMYTLIPVFNALIALYIYYISDPTMNVVFALMLSFPLLPFTYVHNNFWGFFNQNWLALRMSPSGPSVRWKLYLGALGFPLLLDFVSSFLALWLSGVLEVKHFVLYLMLVPPVLLLGYWSSIRFPRKVSDVTMVHQMTSFKNNTSGLSSFIIILLCYGLSLLVILGYTMIALGAAVLACGMAVYLIRTAEPESDYLLAAKLFR